MDIGEKFQSVIEKVVFGGDGMCKAPDGIVVFVENALPGEKLVLEITQVRKNFARAKIVRFDEVSPERIEPVCPYHHLCSNCKYLCCSFAYENELKTQQLRDIVENSIPEVAALIQPMIYGDEFHYRNKVVFHAHRVSKQLDLGYVKNDNVSVVDIPECLLLNPEICDEYTKIRQNLSVMHSLRDGMELTLRSSSAKNQVIFYRNSPDERASWIREKFDFGEFSVPLGGFFQVNLKVAEKLAKQVAETARIKKCSNFIDLYCGSGFFSFAAAALCPDLKTVTGIEIDAKAVECAKFNLAKFPQVNSTFYAQDSAKNLTAILKNCPEDSLLTIDPPRNGLDIKTLNAVCQSSNIKSMIYISCNPSTWVRDALRLKKSGFQIKTLQGFNMFSRTGHFELFSLFER